jgi:hypothetical protein
MLVLNFKNLGMLQKVDMMKAYDRVEWDYLEAIMAKFRFSPQWILVVMSMVRKILFYVLFNGEKS